MLANEVPEAEDDRQIPGSNQAGYTNDDDIAANRAVVKEMKGNKRAYITVLILFIINLLNYMDRQTIPGLLNDIQPYFGIENNNSAAGLLQTVFICSYMILAPVFGYLGDRYRRKYLMAAGILIWSGTVFLSTLLSKDAFWWFLVLRGVVGIGEASYSTIAPTVIADLFTGDKRTRMLSVFYFAIPLGSGLGYIVGTGVAKLLGGWQWGLRVTPIIGAVCVILCLFVVHEPRRGAIERGENPNAVSASVVHHTTSWWADLKYLTTVKSFIWLDLGFTCVSFVTGALGFWAPKFLLYASKAQGLSDATESDISLKVGGITCLAGVVGVWMGAEIAWRCRVRYRTADALVCAVALLGSAPFLYGSLALASINIKVTYALIFFGEVLLFMNWAPVGDMVLYTIIPSRRSTAEAVQILFAHLLGDAGSPWLVGEVSDQIRGSRESNADRARSMEYSLLMTTFISALGGLCFIVCSWYLVKDREAAEEYTRSNEDDSSLLGSIAADTYVATGNENQALRNDEDFDDDYPISSEGDALIVPVDVHDALPVREEQNSHPVI